MKRLKQLYKFRVKNFVIFVVGLICFSITNFDIANAQTSSSSTEITVSPALFEKILGKNHEDEQEIVVINNKDYDIPISVTKGGFQLNGEILSENKEFDQKRFDSSSWITVEPEDFIVEKNSQQKVKIKIKIPENAESGGHYSTIYLNPVVQAPKVDTYMSAQAPRVGVLAFITVKGDLKYNLSINKLVSKFFNFTQPFKFEYQITNSGNVHSAPLINLKVKNYLTGSIKDIKTVPYIIMPATTRTIKIDTDAKYKFGIYKIEMSADYSGGNKTGVLTSTFIYAPIGLILGILLLLTVTYILFILKFSRGNLSRRIRSAFKVLFSRGQV